jgi:hypothetical protein
MQRSCRGLTIVCQSADPHPLSHVWPGPRCLGPVSFAHSIGSPAPLIPTPATSRVSKTCATLQGQPECEAEHTPRHIAACLAAQWAGTRCWGQCRRAHDRSEPRSSLRAEKAHSTSDAVHSTWAPPRSCTSAWGRAPYAGPSPPPPTAYRRALVRPSRACQVQVPEADTALRAPVVEAIERGGALYTLQVMLAQVNRQS